MNTVAILTLPFKQKPETVMSFTFLFWMIYWNRARPCKERHSSLLHVESASFWPLMNYCYGVSSEGRVWISHKTRPSGLHSEVKNASGTTSFIHRITACVRNSSGVDYLQLIFFSWWVAVVRKSHGQFQLNSSKEEGGNLKGNTT